MKSPAVKATRPHLWMTSRSASWTFFCRASDPWPAKATKEWNYRSPNAIAKELVEKGWLRDVGQHRFASAYDPDAAAQPDWIWLPNALVTGAADETPPVELVRQTQDVMTLRLLVDLYHAQNLRDDGGVSRKLTWREYERSRWADRPSSPSGGSGTRQGYVTWLARHCVIVARS